MDDVAKAATVREAALRLLDNDGVDADCLMEVLHDGEEVAAAWLRQNPADDAEPIDEPWLRSVGFTRFMQPASENSLSLEKLILRRKRDWKEWTVNVDGTNWPIKTRGDVRRLAAALGIELKATP